MQEIRRVDVWSIVKISFILSLILGLLVGLFYWFFVFAIVQTIGSLGEASELMDLTGSSVAVGGVGFFVVFFFAILSAVFYSIVNAVLAVLYNLVAGWTGGIRVHLVAERVTDQTQGKVEA